MWVIQFVNRFGQLFANFSWISFDFQAYDFFQLLYYTCKMLI